MTYQLLTEPGEDVLDSRDLFARQEEIEDAYGFDYELFQGPAEFAAHIRETSNGLEDEVADEYERLYNLNQDGEHTFGQAEWQAQGIILIRGGYFEDYAKEVADDVSGADSMTEWPFYYIDWARAAAALQQDYTSIDYAGEAYWGRA